MIANVALFEQAWGAWGAWGGREFLPYRVNEVNERIQRDEGRGVAVFKV